MIFKPATRSVASLFSPVRADPDFGKSKPISGQSPIGVGEAVAIADKVFPDGRLHWVLFPSTPNAAYVVGKQSRDEPNRTKTYRNVGIDQYSGQVLQVQDRESFSAGEKFIEWLFPLHTGEAFGEIGRPRRSADRADAPHPLCVRLSAMAAKAPGAKARRRRLTNPRSTGRHTLMPPAIVIARPRWALLSCPPCSSPAPKPSLRRYFPLWATVASNGRETARITLRGKCVQELFETASSSRIDKRKARCDSLL